MSGEARRTIALALVVVLAAATARGAPDPELMFEGGFLGARLGRSVAEGKDLRTKLQSGLSTTFVIAVRGRAAPPGLRIEGATRVEVRYDLWDEVFIVTHFRPDKAITRDRIPSLEGLGAWWNERVIAIAAVTGATRFDGELELRILPFSFSEERDAQGWVSRALGLSTNAGPVAEPAAGESNSPGQGRMLDALIATSIRAKPISVRRWRLTIPAGTR